MGIALYLSGRLEEIHREFEEALKLCPNGSNALLWKARGVNDRLLREGCKHVEAVGFGRWQVAALVSPLPFIAPAREPREGDGVE